MLSRSSVPRRLPTERKENASCSDGARESSFTSPATFGAREQWHSFPRDFGHVPPRRWRTMCPQGTSCSCWGVVANEFGWYGQNFRGGNILKFIAIFRICVSLRFAPETLMGFLHVGLSFVFSHVTVWRIFKKWTIKEFLETKQCDLTRKENNANKNALCTCTAKPLFIKRFMCFYLWPKAHCSNLF